MNRLATSLAFIPLLAACSHKGAPTDTPSGRATYSGDTAFEARGATATAAPEAPPPGAPQKKSASAPAAMSGAGADSAAVARESEARPGLGTAWGETLSSRVSSAPFERAEPERPFSIASLYYNDANGIRAM